MYVTEVNLPFLVKDRPSCDKLTYHYVSFNLFSFNKIYSLNDLSLNDFDVLVANIFYNEYVLRTKYDYWEVFRPSSLLHITFDQKGEAGTCSFLEYELGVTDHEN